MEINLTVPCLLGVESLVANELKELGAGNVKSENGRVFFTGDCHILARANINSRFAERIQVLVGSFKAESFVELFDQVKALPWEEWIGEADSFPVKGYSKDSTLFSVSDCQSIIKKAIVERLKQKYKLEWFDETGPLHQVQFSIIKDRVLILLDTTGTGLHKRGYRLEATQAPIKETLAAALCQISRLRPYHTLYDPLCGSGTILIEGAMMALNKAPGLNRNFSAVRWGKINQEVWVQERDRARSLEQKADDFFAYGSDMDETALNYAKENAKRAGVKNQIEFGLLKLSDFKPKSERGTLICNPPYGERLLDMEQSEALYKEMGQIFERKRGWSYTIISSSETFEDSFGRKADKRRKLYNGMIKCQAFMYFK
ncbi:MAG: class I SAM-dependent RNA methyltransferase [Clostridiales bacterium]|nr:class I SAM-dependent RNA methyltransferase [Clostridiales bacterium]